MSAYVCVCVCLGAKNWRPQTIKTLDLGSLFSPYDKIQRGQMNSLKSNC